jgi:hypothetical protein
MTNNPNISLTPNLSLWVIGYYKRRGGKKRRQLGRED